MLNLLRSVFLACLGFFKARRRLAIEVLALRHQLGVLKRSVKRPRLTNADRGLWVLFSRRWANWSDALIIVKPDTVIRWHRAGFRKYWAWRSRPKGGRPAIDPQIRALIRRMATANMWGAPRIHGELLKLGIQVSEATVSKCIPRRRKPPSQTWRSFLENHVDTLLRQHSPRNATTSDLAPSGRDSPYAFRDGSRVSARRRCSFVHSVGHRQAGGSGSSI